MMRWKTLLPIIIVLAVIMLAQPSAVYAAPNLTVQPLTWDVVGLDSNNVNTGPNEFPIGARVCNTGPDPAYEVTADFNWVVPGADPYINLATNSLSSLSIDVLAPGDCYDFYFNVEITRDANAYDYSRDYFIEINGFQDAGLTTPTPTITTPQPREIYVERLVSQNRNSVNSIVGPTTVYVGSTYQFTVDSSTATNGYEQIESFLNFPNAVFRMIDVDTTFSADTTGGAYNSQVYADACTWDPDPSSPTYRSCLATGKTGGEILTTYTVEIVGFLPGGDGDNIDLSTLIYDFSGSSYHYNSDFDQPPNVINVTVVSPLEVIKTVTSVVDNGGGSYTVTYDVTMTNDGPSPLDNVQITDDLNAAFGVGNHTVTNITSTDFTVDPTYNGNTVQTLLAGTDTLAAMSSGTVTVTVDVTDTGGSPYNNLAEGCVETSVGTSLCDNDTVPITLGAPDLMVTKDNGQTKLYTWARCDLYDCRHEYRQHHRHRHRSDGYVPSRTEQCQLVMFSVWWCDLWCSEWRFAPE